MVVVEDLISTGGSVLEAVAAAEREGADVLGVVAIFTYELEKANSKFADADVKLATLTNYSELIEIAKETGYVTKEELELLKNSKKIKKLGKHNLLIEVKKSLSAKLIVC